MWTTHNQKMQELKRLYQKTSKQTQNNLQKIFDSFNFKYEELYSYANTNTKKRINAQIEEWKDSKLLKGYFGTLSNNIYKRTKVKNNEILELLIYGAYVEEQNKIQDKELDILKENANYYYQEGQKEVNQTLKSKKKVSVIPDALFLYLLGLPSSGGITWEQYIELNIRYNADNIYRQAIINASQQKPLKIENIEFQKELKKQETSKLNIHDNIYSGSVDNFAIGINNNAKIEGIKSFDENAKVRFIAVEDSKTTMMCQSLDNQIFNINKENIFGRYDGEDKKYKQYRCMGLVTGLNLPPINSTFHFCRSTIIYNIDDISTSIARNGIKIATKIDEEQYARYKKYYGDKLNMSLEEFAKMKYNNNEKYFELKQNYYNAKKQYEVRNNIGNFNIKPVKQGQHIKASKYYKEEKGRSYFDLSEEEVYKLINSKKGTGEMLYKNDNYREIIVSDNNIGYFINNEYNLKEKTDTFIIVYSKDGIHAYPIKTRSN